MQDRYMVGRCQLLSGIQTYVIQVLLGLIALSTLWYKRTVERPKRSFEIWSLDVSKQGIGAIFGHVSNLLIAMVLPPVTDECVWYFLNFVADVTLGTVLCIAFLKFQQELALIFNWTSVQDSGEYGNPINYVIWGKQLLCWLSIVLCSKAIVTSVLISTVSLLARIGNWMFSPLENHPLAELVIVMIICPCFLNVMQFWIQDSFLKRSTGVPTILQRLVFRKTGGNTSSDSSSKSGFDQSLQVALLEATENSTGTSEDISI